MTEPQQTEEQAQQEQPAEDEQEQQEQAPQYNQAGQKLGPDGAPEDAESELIMTKQDGTVTTAEKEQRSDGGQDS